MFIQNGWAFEKREFAFVLTTGTEFNLALAEEGVGGGSGKGVGSLAENFRALRTKF